MVQKRGEDILFRGRGSSAIFGVFSLTIHMSGVTLLQVRDVMTQLPNLNDLSLWMYLESKALPEIGAVLKGRFGGQLELSKGSACSNIVNMLLEIPTGLHFTDVRVLSARECLLSTVRLTEVCADTLVSLTYMVDPHCKSHRLWCTGYRY